jgi:hypothetical protein
VIQFPVTWLYTLHNTEVHILKGFFGRNFHCNGLSVTSFKKIFLKLVTLNPKFLGMFSNDAVGLLEK